LRFDGADQQQRFAANLSMRVIAKRVAASSCTHCDVWELSGNFAETGGGKNIIQ